MEEDEGKCTDVWDSTVLRDPLLERDAVRMDGMAALFSHFIT